MTTLLEITPERFSAILVETDPIAALASINTGHTKDLCDILAKYGCIQLLHEARKRGYCWSLNAICLAAENGHLETVKWLRGNGCWAPNVFRAAAKGGHLEIILWLLDEGYVLDFATQVEIAQGAYVKKRQNIIDWTQKRGFDRYAYHNCWKLALE